MTCSWTPHAEKTSAFLNHWGRSLLVGMCEWQCGCLGKTAQSNLRQLFLSAHVMTGPERCPNSSIRSFQEQLTLHGYLIWAYLKQSARYAEYKDLEHEYMSLCTQIYILKLYSTTISWVSLRVIFTLNPFCPYIIQCEEGSAPRQASGLEIQLPLVIKNDEGCRRLREGLAPFHELRHVHPALLSQ